MQSAVRAENLSKVYRLGRINHGMLYKDIQSKFAIKKGKQDPNAKIGAERHYSDKERFWALKDVSFNVEQGSRVGIIGRNGAGKSTLLKIVSRITAPTEGIVKISGSVTSLLEVGTGFHPELTGRENIFLNGAILGMKKREVAKKFDEIVAFSEIEKFIDTPVKRYSSGMHVRLAFAVAAHLDSDILLADEVLAVGDMAFQKKCLSKMEDVSKSQGRTVLFVSHNLASVRWLCSDGILLNSGRVQAHDEISRIIDQYLELGAQSRIDFEGEPLRWATAYQKGDKIILEAEYDSSLHLGAPLLGFSFYDLMGTAIFGVNPRNIPVQAALGDLEKERIYIEIREPLLLNGTYSISLWFGDQHRTVFKSQNCLTIDIIDMAPKFRAQNPEITGPIFPAFDYHFGR